MLFSRGSDLLIRCHITQLFSNNIGFLWSITSMFACHFNLPSHCFSKTVTGTIAGNFYLVNKTFCLYLLVVKIVFIIRQQ